MARRRSLRLHPRAEEEAVTAFRWYASRNPWVADSFRVELDAAMTLIAESPLRWPSLRGNLRRFVLGRFPFSVVYTVQSEEVEVVAIAHHRRRPGYWAERE